jgi:hypothetical protein
VRVRKIQRGIRGGLLLVSLACLGSSAEASTVQFVGLTSPFGFDASTPGFPTTPDLVMTPAGQSFSASSTPSANSVHYSLDHCLLLSGGSACQAGIPIGTAYTDIVTLTLESTPVSAPAVESGLYLLIGGMASSGYTVDDVLFDTAGQANPEVDPLLYLRLDLAGPDFHYFGFRFENIGESRTLRYDVAGMAASGTPVILTSAYYSVPEPSSGSLLLLGLVVLALREGR